MKISTSHVRQRWPAASHPAGAFLQGCAHSAKARGSPAQVWRPEDRQTAGPRVTVGDLQPKNPGQSQMLSGPHLPVWGDSNTHLGEVFAGLKEHCLTQGLAKVLRTYSSPPSSFLSL